MTTVEKFLKIVLPQVLWFYPSVVLCWLLWGSDQICVFQSAGYRILLFRLPAPLFAAKNPFLRVAQKTTVASI